MNPTDIPDVVVLRLPLYVRALTQLHDEGAEVVSSQELGGLLHMTPAQIRKDLSYFGRFGKQGRGYNVRFLRDELREILGLDRAWPSCLIGVGHLGQAILNYPGFAPEGFDVVAAFDSDPEQVGGTFAGLTVQPMSELAEVMQGRGILIGVVAVPASQAQSVIDHLVSAGVRAILNYAPVAPRVPAGVFVRNVDPVLSLQSLTFYLLRDVKGSGPGP